MFLNAPVFSKRRRSSASAINIHFKYNVTIKAGTPPDQVDRGKAPTCGWFRTNSEKLFPSRPVFSCHAAAAREIYDITLVLKTSCGDLLRLARPSRPEPLLPPRSRRNLPPKRAWTGGTWGNTATIICRRRGAGKKPRRGAGKIQPRTASMPRRASVHASRSYRHGSNEEKRQEKGRNRVPRL